MLQTLAKRLLLLSNIIIGTAIVCFVFFLQTLDARTFQAQLMDLKRLEDVTHIKSIGELEELSPEIYSQFMSWLRTNDSKLADAHLAARETIARWLTANGLRAEQLSRLVGKGGSAEVPFYMFYPGVNSVPGEDEPTVERLLDKLMIHGMPRTVSFAVGVRKTPPFFNFDRGMEPVSISMSDAAHLDVRARKAGPPQPSESRPSGQPPSPVRSPSGLPPQTFGRQDITQADPSHGSTLVGKAELEMRSVQDGPSLLYLNDANVPTRAALEDLNASSPRKQALRDVYGPLRIDQATSLAAQGATDAYQRISIFGMTFSTRRFPLIVLGCLMLALIGTLITLGHAQRATLNIIRGDHDPELLDAMLDYAIGRFLLWVVVPALALWGSLPLMTVPSGERAVLVSGGVINLLLGIGCLVRATRVQRLAIA